MSESRANFTGSVPEFYHRYLGPFLFEPYAADLVRRLPTGTGAPVLELACGTGIATRHLRAALPPATQLVATDLNPAMMEKARMNMAGADVHWRTADAAELPFKDEAFGTVACQFGFMFLPDRARGFREARRVLRAGGTLLASVWCSLDDNPSAAVAHRTVGRMFEDDPPLFLLVPYGSVSGEALRTLAAEAGFSQIDVERVAFEGRAPSARDVAIGMAKGSPMAAELTTRGADLDAVVDAFARALDPSGDGPFRSPMAAFVLTAS